MFLKFGIWMMVEHREKSKVFCFIDNLIINDNN